MTTLPVSVSAELSRLLAEELLSTYAVADTETSSKPALRTLTWLDEATLRELQASLVTRLSNAGADDTVVGVLTGDDSSKWSDGHGLMRIDEAHEFRDKSADTCRLLVLLIPADMETRLRKSGLDNPGSPLELDGLWPRVAAELLARLPAAVVGPLLPVHAHLDRLRRRAFDIAVYLGAIADRATPESVGRELWRVDLVPDLGGDPASRIIANDACVREISQPKLPQADLDTRLGACRLQTGDTHVRLKALLGHPAINIAQPRSWLRALVESDELEAMTFDQWPLDTAPSSLEAIQIADFFKPDGTCNPKCKLLQPGEPNTALYASKKVALSWTTTPSALDGISGWRVELVPSDAGLLEDLPELPAMDVGGSKRSAVLSVIDLPDDDETVALVRRTQFRIRVTALDGLAQVVDDSGSVIEHLSDEFFLSADADPDEVASTSGQQSNMSLARLVGAQRLKGTELSHVRLPSEPGAVNARFSTELASQFDVRIPFNSTLAAVSDLSRLHDGQRGAIDLPSGEPLTADAMTKMLTFDGAAIPEPLRSRRRDVIAVLDSVGVPMEAIDTAEWSRRLDKRVRAYARAFAEALDEVTEAERGRLLTMDTVSLTIRHRDKTKRAVLLMPTHPMRALWYAQYVATLRGIEEDLLDRAAARRASAVDLELLEGVAPANYPMLAIDSEGRAYCFSQALSHSTTLHIESADPEPHLTRSLVQTAFALSADVDPVDLPPRQLTDRLRLYLRTHDYVRRLSILAVNAGASQFLPEALGGLYQNTADASLDMRSRHLSIVAVEPNTAAPNPAPAIQALQHRLHSDELVHRGTTLRPAVEIVVDESVADHQANVAVVIEPGTPEAASGSPEARRRRQFHGLITPTVTTFEADDLGARWRSQAGTSNPKEPDKSATLLGTVADSYGVALGAELGLGPNPGLVIQYDLDELEDIERMHRQADWVINVSRYTGSELLDSPADAFVGARSRKYVLDYSPDFRDGFGHRMTVSTEYRSELETLLQKALAELGFGDAELSSTVLLDDLRSISGRLALRLVEVDTFALEAAGLAVVARYLRQSGQLDQTIVIPVDAHHDLFGTHKGQASHETGRRCDLLLIRPKARQLEIEFVEVKQRTNATTKTLLDYIASQTESTQQLVENEFFSGDAHADHRLRRSRLSNLLHGYLDRTARHGYLATGDREALEERLDRLEFGYEEFVAKRTGYIVNLSATPKAPIDHKGTTIHHLTEQDLAPTGLVSARTEASRLSKVEPALPVDHPVTSESSGGGSSTDAPSEGASEVGEPADELSPEVTTVPAPDPDPLPTDQAEPSPEVPADPSDLTAPMTATSPGTASIELGTARSTDSPVTWTISTKGSPHLFVIGMPGQGKSWTILRIVDEFARQGLPSLIFDYHGQFANELPVQLPTLDLLDGLPFSPFEASTEKGRDNWKVNAYQVADILAYVGGLGPIQRDQVYKAVLASYEASGFEIGKPSGLPTVAEFFEHLGDLEKGTRGGQNASARLRPLLDFGLFREPPDDTIQTLFTGGAIIDFSQMEIPEVQNAGGAFILRKLYREMTTWGETDRLRLAVILDEAHRLAKDVTLPKLMKEGRKFGLVIVVASQNNNDFHADVLQNAGSKVVFRLNIGEAKKAAGFVRGKASTDLTPEIENLPVGEAFVQTAEMPRALRTRMHPFR